MNEKVFNKILRKKFNGFVGTFCERVEYKTLDSKIANELKFDLKKDAYNAMREIESQVSLYSEGVTININLNRPDSEQ